MSLVPLLFRDWWDDLDRDRPSRLLDQHFGIGLKRDDLFNNLTNLPSPLIRPGRYFRPWAKSLAHSNSGMSNIKDDDHHFQASFPNTTSISMYLKNNQAPGNFDNHYHERIIDQCVCVYILLPFCTKDYFI